MSGTRPTPPPAAPAPESRPLGPSWLGGSILALLVAIAAATLYSERDSLASAGARPEPLPAALPADLSRFDAAAWYLPADATLGFVEIPAGPFLMGSDPAVDPAAFDNEWWPATRSRATVELPAYYIGRHEVTVAQYRAFVEATGHRVEPQALRAPGDHPVASVSWPDALAYARWLEGELRASPRTPEPLRRRLEEGWRVTLPTEAQWEKAARGTDGRVFPWGDEPRRDRANFQGPGPAPVGSLPCPECPFGLTDMSGNVWELTRSPYQPYPYDEADDGSGLDADALWVMRGGAFNDPPRNTRAAVRGGADPGVRRPFIGFRLVVSPS